METTTQERTTRGFEQSTIQTDHTPVGAAERVIGDLTEWSIGAAKESARLVAELQMAVFGAPRIARRRADDVARGAGRSAAPVPAGLHGDH